VRLAIIDRDPLLRNGIRSMMEAHPRIMVTGDFDSVRGAGLSSARPEVLLVGADLLDDQLPGAIRQVRHDRPPAVVTVMEPGDQWVMRSAVMCSVRGFVDRNTSHEDLSVAVQEVHKGHTFLSSAIAEKLIGWMTTRIRSAPISVAEVEQALTERELEVLRALGDGITNTMIARRLDIQEGTVRSHTYRILTKLNLRTRTEAVLVGHTYANTRRLPQILPG
jgi:DNA-binding NarL/FixJ family response regulator